MSDRSRTLSRRALLAAAGAAAAGLIAPRALRRLQAAAPLLQTVTGGSHPAEPEWSFIQPQEARLDLWGRITYMGYPVRAEPGLNKEVVRWLHESTVLPLVEVVHAEGPNPNNDTWYRIADGYLYTAGVQVMRPYRTPQILSELPHTIDEEPGVWAEVIVPLTLPRREPAGTQVYDEFFGVQMPVTLYYGSVHRVIGIEQDADGYVWYSVFDDKPKNRPFYVNARHMRYIPPEEFAPINPGARGKRIEVTLAAGRIDCYEGDTIVFSTLTSSGAGGFPTPDGEHAVVFKQPSRHMYTDPEDPVSGGSIDEDFFNLPGVPFNTFLTTLGHAIHGTWWHGDYGRPRSHGCLNVTPEAARWIYRWVEPVAGYEQASAGSSRNPGTPIIVI
jgi:lipoprotein-anchoring transpeptidase ErfK/SrfK